MAAMSPDDLEVMLGHLLDARRAVNKALAKLEDFGQPDVQGSLQEAWGLMAGAYAELRVRYGRGEL